MPATLSFGSVGPLVKQLQEGLNQLVSRLPRLVPDGRFGPKTRTRVQELQTSNRLSADGIVGPMTWELLARLLQQVAAGGLTVLPGMQASSFDVLRPLVLSFAQMHMGKVDFSQMVGGRPRGIDFVKEVFQFAANQTLTDTNFRANGTGGWMPTPWVGVHGHVKSWCGIFAVYCYRKAGHIRVDILVGHFKGRRKWIAELMASIAAFALIVLLLPGVLHFFENAYFIGDSTINTQWPTWPSKLVPVIGFSVLALRIALEIWAYIRLVADPLAEPIAVPVASHLPEDA